MHDQYSTPQITATVVDRDYLQPALDARACNLGQERALVRLLADVNRITGQGNVATVADMTSVIREFAESNHVEGECEKQIAASADELQRLLAGAERNGMSDALTSRAIAEHLRPALHVLQNLRDHDAREIVRSASVVHRVIDSVPATQLLSPTVEKRLRDGKFRLLAHLHETRSREAA